MSKKTPKKRVWALEAAVFSALRRAQRNSPDYHACLKAAKGEYHIPSKKGKPMRRVEFQCASCSDKANRKGVAVDHIEAVINPTTGFTDFDTYVKRLFVKANQLQVLCKACHNAKSKAENAIRRKIKKEKENKV